MRPQRKLPRDEVKKHPKRLDYASCPGILPGLNNTSFSPFWERVKRKIEFGHIYYHTLKVNSPSKKQEEEKTNLLSKTLD